MPENRAIHQNVDAFRQRLAATAPLVPANTQSTIFDHHNCWRCRDGERPCVAGHPRSCEYPRAKND